MKFSWKVGNGPVNKRLNFGGDPDHGYPDPDSGKTCHGGGMHKHLKIYTIQLLSVVTLGEACEGEASSVGSPGDVT